MLLNYHPSKGLTKCLDRLKEHLRTENPLLLAVIPTYLEIDRVLYKMGLLKNAESLATRIPWWPLISILGTFSSGKSTFINSYLEEESLQATGNQAVDDKFTVICYGTDGMKVLPGTALDADPRFPFYRMSNEIEKVAPGEGRRVDTYLQLKTTEKISSRGKIIIDSPGFDADDQRRSVLRLTQHIIDLSDLVLVFFDARHPEPGAMQDTLLHLVANTVNRSDASKFLYILNQIDTTAQEDNPEQVVGAWQRAVAQVGLVSGHFYCIYDARVAIPIADHSLRKRFESKRNQDLAEIYDRINTVETQRRYRIVSVLESVLDEIELEIVPSLQLALQRWRRLVLMADAVGVTLLISAILVISMYLSDIIHLDAVRKWFGTNPLLSKAIVTLLIAITVSGHYTIKEATSYYVAARLPESIGRFDLELRRAFLRSSRPIRPVLWRVALVGYGARMCRRFKQFHNTVAIHIQHLNDIYTDPSGRRSQSSVETQ